MSDIVERLRKRRDVVLGVDTDCAEAAAEIERLRAALEDILPVAESYLNIIPDRRGRNIAKLEAACAALNKGGEG